MAICDNCGTGQECDRWADVMDLWTKKDGRKGWLTGNLSIIVQSARRSWDGNKGCEELRCKTDYPWHFCRKSERIYRSRTRKKRTSIKRRLGRSKAEHVIGIRIKSQLRGVRFTGPVVIHINGSNRTAGVTKIILPLQRGWFRTALSRWASWKTTAGNNWIFYRQLRRRPQKIHGLKW